MVPALPPGGGAGFFTPFPGSAPVSRGHKREGALGIEEAKPAETRAGRIAKSAADLKAWGK